MSFISYAQNFEDVMLWRALKHIEHGCYVDVGAQHPVIDSVSKAFYERGWRGVHIEPVPEYADLLRKDRPDETVLQVALADTEGTLELYVVPDTGLSTAVDAYAQRHQVERGLEHQRIQVPVLTLKSALTSLVGKDVHWLKIDVEGLEEKVLKGWDSQILRPWVMVVEATIPNSPETDYASWDPVFTAADYQFAYFDGLNRFYVAKEHAELAEAFACPPNVFDDVELSGLASWGLCRGLIASQQASEKELSTQAKKFAIELDSERQRTMQLGAELQAAREYESRLQAHAQGLQNEWDTAKAKIDELNQSSHHWRTMADGLNRELQRVYATKSWRITWPLRKADVLFKRSARMIGTGISIFTSLPRRAARWVLLSALTYLQARPEYKANITRALARFPFLHARMRKFSRTQIKTQGSFSAPPSSNGADPMMANRFQRQLELELIRRRQSH